MDQPLTDMCRHFLQIVNHPVCGFHLGRFALEGFEVSGLQDRLRTQVNRITGVKILKQLGFRFRRRQPQREGQRKTVELRLWQWGNADLFSGILGRNHQKRIRQCIGRTVYTGLALRHGLQQSTLTFTRCPVQFINQKQLREQGAFPKGKGTRIGVKYVHPQNI